MMSTNCCYDRYFRPDVDQQPQLPQTNHAPAMMTFKQFLNAQDDNISDEEAFKKYQEYKLEFRKTQMSDFFQQHKEEEWYVVTSHELFLSVSLVQKLSKEAVLASPIRTFTCSKDKID